MAEQILLTKGRVTLVDSADYDWLNQWKWHYNGTTGYAARRVWSGPNQGYKSMHRVIMNAPENLQVDHISGDKLDNRRSNLRLVTAKQNMRNMSALGGKSQYKGVSFYDNVFVVRLYLDGANLYFGRFSDEVSAAKVYDYAARQHYGEHARLNFPNNTLSLEEFNGLVNLKTPNCQYRGVSYIKSKGRWRSYIQSDGKLHHLGYFKNPVDAAIAYDEAAIRFHGSKAKLNFQKGS